MGKVLSIKQRASRKTTLYLLAVNVSLCALVSLVFAGYFLVAKPRILAKTRNTTVAQSKSSLYGSAENLLSRPRSVALDAKGEMFVADTGNGSIAVMDAYGQRTKTIGAKQLKSPVSVAVAKNGTLYVVDSTLKELLIFKAGGAFWRSVSFVEQPPVSVTVAKDAAGRERLYVTTASGIVRGTLDGVMEFGYFNAGSSGAELNTPTAVCVLQGKNASGQRIVVADSLNGRIVALDSHPTSPTVAWENDSFVLPTGVTTDGTHLYVTDAMTGTVSSVNPVNGTVQKTFSERGRKDGNLYYPSAVAYCSDTLYVADTYNDRVSTFSTKATVPSTRVILPLEQKLPYVLPFIILCIADVVIFILCVRLRTKRYVLDVSVAERVNDTGEENLLELLTNTVYVSSGVEGFIHRTFARAALRVKPLKVSSKDIERITEKYPHLDRFDIETLALCRKMGTGALLISNRPDVIGAAREIDIEAQSFDELTATARDIRYEEHPHIEDSSDEGFAGIGFTLVVVLIALSVAFVPVLAGAADVATSAQGAKMTVTLSKLPSPTGMKSVEGTANIKASGNVGTLFSYHDDMTRPCSVCHESTAPGEATLLTDSVSQCQYCHTSSGIAPNTQTYTAENGNASSLGADNSGHAIGVHDGIPASGETGYYDLSCTSCHAQHGGKKVAQCVDCHTKATSKSAPSDVSEDTFSLTKSVTAHARQTGVDNGAGNHATLACVACHRGDLSVSNGCKECHYTTADFDKDTQRSGALNDWPHTSRNDTALLGNWTTSSKVDTLGEKVAPTAGKMSLENQTRSICGRCHTTPDGTNYYKSIHTLKHDAVVLGSASMLTSKTTTSTLQKISPGYVGTGIYKTAAHFKKSFNFGPDGGSYENVSCAQCHYSDVQTEHTMRSKKGCQSCHVASASGQTDWTQVEAGMTTDSFATCGTTQSACHLKDWHGNNPTRVEKSHALVAAHGKTLKASSCAGSDVSQTSCHGSKSISSLFNFGSVDIASAHNDYWFGENVAGNTNKQYTKTIDQLTDVRGCGLCHNKRSSTVAGASARAAAKSSNAIFDCATCHNDRTKIYAESLCYKAPKTASTEKTAENKKTESEKVTAEAKSYLDNLAVQNESSQAQTSKAEGMLEGAAIESTLKSIPPEFLPVSRPFSLSSPFSIMRIYLLPYPSIMNRSTNNWEDV
ncbi:MAG: cytochrome c3 family protein [Coriobacteriia bacterium]|nr:cytochrome c3 family protein [Coriobacteriia bacterium]